MLDTLTKKIVAGSMTVALAGIGGVVGDKVIVTDNEVKVSINQAILDGKIPEVDLNKVSFERVAHAYAEIALENGVDLSPTTKTVDLYEKIRDAKANKGEKLLPKTNAVLLVQ